ncbi:hypothetical protein [Sediminibacter sp. Hel_I_10]|uniref:hypothetical protein n=1 Tax=Sediminibacter sp. Hel_I_10 TaxID=1392490 RepID=UPI00047DE46A|nr:hypothetical protein [Sediminibacter sp. Hel_I_10]
MNTYFKEIENSNYYTDLYNSIGRKLSNGNYYSCNKTYNPNHSILDNGRNFDCKVIVDNIYDVKTKELIYRVERHLGNNTDYFTYEIFNVKLNHQVESIPIYIEY